VAGGERQAKADQAPPSMFAVFYGEGNVCLVQRWKSSTPFYAARLAPPPLFVSETPGRSANRRPTPATQLMANDGLSTKAY
jgi:hypothetical protein